MTGFAVFMRYVCIDRVGCDDPDVATRRAIERAVREVERAGLSFLDAFTDAGRFDEKNPRLAHLAQSDQPVIYASAMLELWREGGDGWLRRFFARLLECPECTGSPVEVALAQGLHWLVAASLAIREDLTPLFVDRWRLPLPNLARERLGRLVWSDALRTDDVLAIAHGSTPA